jgi:ring-1,2-phenylacetyl-CoA epoxidase subunit PaaD
VSAEPHTGNVARAWQRLERVMDPELPQLSVLDLGMIRSVEERQDGSLRVGVSPTYSGCPAQRVIHEQIRAALHASGIERVEIHAVLAPAWPSDWITDRGRAILRECGIAPPASRAADRGGAGGSAAVACPLCRSTRTQRVSEFGSTPCKAQYRCLECLEPFEYFKCI